MKFGLRYAKLGRNTQRPAVMEPAQAAEAADFDSIWTVEHVVVPDRCRADEPGAGPSPLGGGDSWARREAAARQPCGSADAGATDPTSRNQHSTHSSGGPPDAAIGAGGAPDTVNVGYALTPGPFAVIAVSAISVVADLGFEAATFGL